MKSTHKLMYMLQSLYGKKVLSNMRKMFRSSCTRAKYHPGLYFTFIHSVVSSDPVSRQEMSWSECAYAQADLCLRCPRMPDIKETCLYNSHPIEPHFYIVKLEFKGYTLFYLFLLKNIDLGYSLEPPRQGGSNEFPQSMFWAEIWKISDFFIWNFSVFGGESFYIFEYACFRNETRFRMARPICPHTILLLRCFGNPFTGKSIRTLNPCLAE